MFAYQECVETRRGKPGYVFVCIDAAFAHTDQLGRNSCSEIERGFQMNLKGSQIAIIYADDRRARGEGLVQLFIIVNFYEGGDQKLSGKFPVMPQLRFGKNGGDQKDRVGTGSSGFQNMQLIDGEVLAQHRQTGRRSGGLQVLQATLKEIAIGEDGESRGAAGLVLTGDDRGLVILDQETLGRRRPLNFGDDCRGGVPEGGSKRPPPKNQFFGLNFELSPIQIGRTQLLAFPVYNAREDVRDR